MVRILTALAVIIALGACNGTTHNTSSGKPETCVFLTDMPAVIQIIEQDMRRTGYTIKSKTSNQLVVEKLAKEANIFGTTIYQQSVIDVIPNGSCTQVSIDFYRILRGMGKEERESLNNSPLSKNVQAYLDQLYSRFAANNPE